ncbi:MAG: hypothetical protein OXU36_09965 [Candidatus Poribacteria bacterium]|nr:hypothetical protein [Candidatus Poribacteria bacterium]
MDRIKGRITPFQEVLLDEFPEDEKYWEFQTELQELFDTLAGDELVLTVVERLHRFTFAEMTGSSDTDFEGLDWDTIGMITERVREILMERIAGFITDAHRESIIRYHARGFSTAAAVSGLIREDSTMNRLAQKDAIGEKELRDLLISRFAYLKPGTARWPEKKYGDLWRESREAYKQELHGIPLIAPVERVMLLVKHAARINDTLENEKHTAKDLQILTDSLTKTIESLQKLSTVENQEAVDLSVPQFMAILERLTLALDAPNQLARSGDTHTLIEGLERLTFVLKSSGHSAIGGETENVLADTHTKDDDSE